ncbi:MAG TPA: ATP-binding cassette domain-containing protein, partial [Acidimicrobiales bacterium]
MAGTGTAHLRPVDDVLLRAEHLVVDFPSGHGQKVSAVADVSFDVAGGETLGLVGESGCGKTTTARLILRALRPTRGEIRFALDDAIVRVDRLEGRRLRALRRHIQLIFQDPVSSLNPRMPVGDIIA